MSLVDSANDTRILTLSRRHAENQHSFFYCNVCCTGFKSSSDKDAYLPQCSQFCIAPHCMGDQECSKDNDLQVRKHRRAPSCPVTRKVEVNHRLEYFKHCYQSLFPCGSEPRQGEQGRLHCV